MATLYALQRVTDSQWFTGFSDLGAAEWSGDASKAMLHKNENNALNRQKDMAGWNRPVVVRIVPISVPNDTPVTAAVSAPSVLTADVPGATDPQAVVKSTGAVIDLNETGAKPAPLSLIPVAIATAALFALMG